MAPSNIGYSLRECGHHFRRNWTTVLGAVVTIFLSLFIIGLFLAQIQSLQISCDLFWAAANKIFRLENSSDFLCIKREGIISSQCL